MSIIPEIYSPQNTPGFAGIAKIGNVFDFVEDYLQKNCASADEYNELLKVYSELKRELGELRVENAALQQTVKTYTDLATDATTKYHVEMRKRMKLEKILEHLEKEKSHDRIHKA